MVPVRPRSSRKDIAICLIAALSALALFLGAAAERRGMVAPAYADSGSGSDGDGSDNSGSGSDGDGSDDGDDGTDNSGSGSANSGSGSDDDDGDDDGDGEDDDNATTDSGQEAGGRDREFVPDEVVVADPSPDFVRTAQDLGFVVLDQQPLSALGLTVARLRVPGGMTALTATTLLAERFPDLVTDLNDLYRPQSELTLPAPGYGARLIGWGDVSRGCGRGMRIGMVDTAIDQSRSVFDGAQIRQRSFLHSNARPAPPVHGTAVAAILAGQDPRVGLLPAAEIFAAEVFAIDRSDQLVADVVAVVQGLDWLAKAEVSAINLSLSGSSNRLLGLAIKRLIDRGTAIVAAAGNDGATGSPSFPAAEPGVIAVTAVDSGKTIYDRASRGDYVDFSAPGVRIWVPDGDDAGQYHSGTSFAVPYVTATIAAARHAGAATASEAEAALASAAEDLGDTGRDPVFGWGLIRAGSLCGELNQ
jgi:hypothetical protein